MATSVTVTAEYRIDDYFDERQSGGDIYIYTSSGGSFFDPSLYYSAATLDGGQLDNRYFTETESDARFVRLTTNQTIAGQKTFSSLATFSAGINVTGGVTATGEVESWDTSDKRLKEEIQDLPYRKTLASLMKLRAVRYWHKLKKRREIGLIAQEVIKDFPEVVKKNDEGYLMIQYGKLVPALLVAIQALKEEIDILKDMLSNGIDGE